MTHSGSAWLGLISYDSSVFSTQRGARKQPRGYEAFLEREHQELLSQAWRKNGPQNESLGANCGRLLVVLVVLVVGDRLAHISTLWLWSQVWLRWVCDGCDPLVWRSLLNQNSQEIKEMLNLNIGQQRDARMHMQMVNAPPFPHPCLRLHGSPLCSTRSHVEGLRWQTSTQSKRLDWLTLNPALSVSLTVWSSHIDFPSELCS